MHGTAERTTTVKNEVHVALSTQKLLLRQLLSYAEEQPRYMQSSSIR